MNKKIFFSSLFFYIALSFFSFALADTIEINFFSSKTCPHCAKERVFLEDLKQKYPEVNVIEYEVVQNQENKKILKEFYERYNVPEAEQGWVPITFTPLNYFIGFNENTGQEIEGCLKNCLRKDDQRSSSAGKIKIPLWGLVDLSKMSLLGLTFVLGILDGFNPCAMWILVILVSLLLPLRSRKKIALVGGTFIFAEGLLYFLFMTAWLNIFLAVEYGYLTKILIGAFGIIFGIWRLREFFAWKPGVCKVTESSSSQGKIVGRMEKVLAATSWPAIILGVFTLAFAVNLIEFLCSAGFPVMYARILALQNIGVFQHYFYLFLYNIFYMADDLLVFGFAFFFLNRFHFSDKYNKYSTLAAGILILVLGILLIFKPELLMFG